MKKISIYKPGTKKYYEDSLCNIWAMCLDYDGFRTTEGLKSLIDDIKQIAANTLDNKPLYVALEGE